jgi:hypothetical protein
MALLLSPEKALSYDSQGEMMSGHLFRIMYHLLLFQHHPGAYQSIQSFWLQIVRTDKD